jgi:hypothetical protein
VTWLVRDLYLGNTFFDASASAFIAPSLHLAANNTATFPPPPPPPPVVSPSESLAADALSEIPTDKRGVALGPEWIQKTGFLDKLLPGIITERKRSLDVINNTFSTSCTISFSLLRLYNLMCFCIGR